MKERISQLIKNLKHAPGVYLMFNKDDKVIYVGKAIDLYKRVSQYFLHPQVGKVLRMREEAERFETIICQNEKEALVLERNLIAKYYPKYNIMLKDDKHYPYITIKDKNDPYLSLIRKEEKNNVCFGPFPSSSSAYKMIELLNSIFPLRKCKNIPSTPCLYYHLGQCLAPCIHKINKEEYDKLTLEIKDFLRGNNKKIYDEIKEKMNNASLSLDYELAGSYKKILDSINHINMSQNVEIHDKKDRDIFAYSIREQYLSIAILMYRNGTLLGKESYVLELFSDEEEFVINLITQFYEKHNIPDEIIINNKNIIESLKKYYDCEINNYTKGKYLELILSAKENAENALGAYFLTSRLDEDKIELLESLGKILSINTPYEIVLFDNSHIQGYAPVGAMVTFINAEPAKKLYRKFHINSEDSKDDYNSMKEVTYRHFLRLKEENNKLPDLILADGGIGQVHAIKETLDRLSIDIPLFGLYKNDKHSTEGLIDSNGNKYLLKDNKKLFFLLTRMQDEVHRFAITFHKDTRKKKMKESILDNVDGLGERRKEMIKKTFTDLPSLYNASIEDFKQLLPDDVANNLYKKIHQ